jgi:hypothetical protein
MPDETKLMMKRVVTEGHDLRSLANWETGEQVPCLILRLTGNREARLAARTYVLNVLKRDPQFAAELKAWLDNNEMPEEA